MRAKEATLVGATRNLLELQPMVTLLAGATKPTLLGSAETTRTTTMMKAGPAEAEVAEVVVDSRTRVVIVHRQRAALSVEKRVIFQEIALTLAEVAVGAVQEAPASNATKRDIWPVIAPALIQQVAMILKVVAVAEVELQAVVVSATSAKVRAILQENVPMTMVTAMISRIRDRGVMMMVALSAEESATINLLLSSGETTPLRSRTQVHNGVLRLQILLTPRLML